MMNAEKVIKGKKFEIAKTTPNAIKKLDEADELLREYNKEHDRTYLFDEEFRGKYLKRVADVVLEYEDGSQPSEEFYSDGDLEVSTIQKARMSFLANVGMIGV